MMKGDLHTLKKVCMYASKVMLAGSVVLAVVIVAVIAIGAGSFFSDSMSDLVQDVLDVEFGKDSVGVVASSYSEVLAIFVLALITVLVTYLVMVSIHSEHSPFTEENVERVKVLSRIYLVFAVVFLVLEFVKDNVVNMSFMFFGCILLSVVLYMFALIVRYGGLLQDESDHTL